MLAPQSYAMRSPLCAARSPQDRLFRAGVQPCKGHGARRPAFDAASLVLRGHGFPRLFFVSSLDPVATFAVGRQRLGKPDLQKPAVHQRGFHPFADELLPLAGRALDMARYPDLLHGSKGKHRCLSEQ